MSDYTPSTNEVREGFAASQTGVASRLQMHREDFDRWLAKERRIAAAGAVADERERIARNIEGQRIAPYQGSFLGEDDRGWNRAVEQAARIVREGA